MRESLIHKQEKEEEEKIIHKNKCCSLKCMAFSTLSLICSAAICGLIYVNVKCSSFDGSSDNPENCIDIF